MTKLPVTSDEAVDLFAGPGGWDEAARRMGLEPLGIEWDDAACATREAAGLRTKQADVASLNPLDFAPCKLLIASPPCPTFSSAGKGDGIKDMELVWEAAKLVADGTFKPGALDWRDNRSELVVEPLRWTLALQPDYIAWEQVPPVIDFWRYCAEVLHEHGWQTWTGVIEAERYGVPQTRERAILMASRNGHVAPPQPTHQRYVKGEAQRHEVTLDGEVLPWVSMAEALGWDRGVTVNTRGDRKSDGGNEFSADQPSWALTEKTRSWKLRANKQANATERDIDEPAPTITAGHDAGDRCWEEVVYRNGNRDNAAERPATEPAPTLHFGGRSNKVEWVHERPSPTLVTTRRSKDGVLVGRQLPAGEGENVGGQSWDSDDGESKPKGDGEAVRVTLEEAAVLQSFPPDYPFQGSKSKRFEQVGNAVPPQMAHAILLALLVGPRAQ